MNPCNVKTFMAIDLPEKKKCINKFKNLLYTYLKRCNFAINVSPLVSKSFKGRRHTKSVISIGTGITPGWQFIAYVIHIMKCHIVTILFRQ